MPTTTKGKGIASPPKKPSPPPMTPSPPSTVTVYVSIYKPTDDRDPSHWAIFLNGQGAKDVILQVSDDKHGIGYYVEKPMWGKYPQKSAMHRASIAVGTITASSLRAVVATINSTPVDNNSQTWNCQAWCVYVQDQSRLCSSQSQNYNLPQLSKGIYPTHNLHST